jgi:hypothetical protein
MKVRPALFGVRWSDGRQAKMYAAMCWRLSPAQCLRLVSTPASVSVVQVYTTIRTGDLQWQCLSYKKRLVLWSRGFLRERCGPLQAKVALQVP